MPNILNILKLRRFANTGDTAAEVAISTDTQPRLRIDAGGRITWGAGGTTAGDTNLYRDSANVLKTDDSLTVTGDLTVSGTNANLNTTNLSTNSGQLVLNKTNANADGGVVFKRGTSSDVSLWWYSTGNRWLMHDGSIFHTLGKAVYVSDSAPTGYTPNVGDLWYDSDSPVLKIFNYDSTWVNISGGGGGVSETQLRDNEIRFLMEVL